MANQTPPSDIMRFGEVFRFAMLWRRVLTTCTLLGAVVGLAFAYNNPVVYKTSATVHTGNLPDDSSTIETFEDPQQMVNRLKEALGNAEVVRSVGETLLATLTSDKKSGALAIAYLKSKLTGLDLEQSLGTKFGNDVIASIHVGEGPVPDSDLKWAVSILDQDSYQVSLACRSKEIGTALLKATLTALNTLIEQSNDLASNIKQESFDKAREDLNEVGELLTHNINDTNFANISLISSFFKIEDDIAHFDHEKTSDDNRRNKNRDKQEAFDTLDISLVSKRIAHLFEKRVLDRDQVKMFTRRISDIQAQQSALVVKSETTMAALRTAQQAFNQAEIAFLKPKDQYSLKLAPLLPNLKTIDTKWHDHWARNAVVGALFGWLLGLFWALAKQSPGWPQTKE